MSATPIEILLVEDNPDDVELTLRALREHNLANRVKVVSDGVEALEYLRPDDAETRRPTAYPKLVLLDLKLPRVGGIEVLRRLKASERTRSHPGRRDDLVARGERPRGELPLGANSYIVKPVDFEQFMHAVGELGLYWLLLNEVPT